MNRFCPKCGKNDDGKFIKGFCRECFLADHPLASMPEQIEVKQCKRCGKISFKGKWVETDFLEKIAEQALKVSHEIDDLRVSVKVEGEKVRVELLGRLGDSIIRIPLESSIKFIPDNCIECLRLSSNYHEAIIQLRYDNPSRKQTQFYVSEAKSFLRTQKMPLAVLVDFIELKTGLDLLVGSVRAGKNLADYFARHSPVKVSKKLIGKDKSKGKDRYRFTYLVRI